MAATFAARFAMVRSGRGPWCGAWIRRGPCSRRGGWVDDPSGLDRFADIVLDAAAGTVGLVKPQSAFFERHGWRGFRTLSRLIADARSAGLLVVLDVKRGDVGSTNDAYAEAFLGPGAPLEADAVTVHPHSKTTNEEQDTTRRGRGLRQPRSAARCPPSAARCRAPARHHPVLRDLAVSLLADS